MGNTIRIVCDNVTLDAELNDSDSAEAIFNALPVKASCNRWGEEIYFEIPVDVPLTPDATEKVQVGDLGYWPPGHAFCIFFGRTPASTDDEPRAASPVNIVGKVINGVRTLTDVQHGTTIQIEQK